MRIFLLISFLFFACAEPKVKEVNLIPKPQNIVLNDGVFLLDSRTGILAENIFSSEVKYLKSLLKLPLEGKTNQVILSKKEGLQKEEFFLNISSNTLSIEASTATGIMRGIQTLRQLLPTEIQKGVINIPCLEIHDFPRFSWRGMLLDCCRHFMDVEFVKRYIDLLAYHKMNILHHYV